MKNYPITSNLARSTGVSQLALRTNQNARERGTGDGDGDGDEDGDKRERGRGQLLRGRITDNQIMHAIINVFFNA